MQQVPTTMSEQALTTTTTRQAAQAKTASKPLAVTGKLKQAVDLMIETGAHWDDAAVQAGLTVRTMRLALERPHVLAHLKAAREVFRVRASAANIHRLTQIRDAADNMPAVNAIKALEQMSDEPGANPAAVRAPGVVIVIGGPIERHNVGVSVDSKVIDARNTDE